MSAAVRTETLPDADARARAVDVRHSVIVRAPAGSGKTTLLVQRYLKLLAVVSRPEEILAITFTRKAAAEMANRVMQTLRQAAAEPGSDPDADNALARDQEMGWGVLEQPARLKIQTIDSLAMSLTRTLPLSGGGEARLDPTELAEPLYRRAAEQLLRRLYDGGAVSEAIADFVAWLGNDPSQAQRLITAMLPKRDQWLNAVAAVVRVHAENPEAVGSVLGTGIEALNTSVIDTFREALGEALLQELDPLLEHAAKHLGKPVHSIHERHRLAGELLTTTNGTLRRRIDRRMGFLPEHRAEKEALTALLETLADSGLEEIAANLRCLPNPDLDEQSVETLVNVCTVLALSNESLNRVFRAAGQTDFTSLTLNARAALGEPEAPTELALALDYRVHHLLVDEFQDTSVAQFRLLEALLEGWSAGDGNTFFAVGDPMQSIYRFRDAEVSLFYRAWRRGVAGIPLTPVTLSSNFRADARLVAWTNALFRELLGQHEDPELGLVPYHDSHPVRSAAGPGPAVCLSQHSSEEAQIEAIVTHIENLLADSGGKIAVLVRSRARLPGLLQALRDRGIPWRATDIDPLLTRPAVRDLLNLFRLFNDPDDRLAWFSLLRAPVLGLTLPDLSRLAVTDDFPALLEAVVSRPDETPELSSDGQRRLMRLAEEWSRLRPWMGEAPIRSLVETLWIRLGGPDALLEPGELAQAERFLQLLERPGHDADSAEALEEAAATLYAEDLTGSRLEILTIHKAKGLEFDHVIVPFLERSTRDGSRPLLLWRPLEDGLLMGVREDDSGTFAWLARENRIRNEHELERLLYVACTRARESLRLFCTHQERPAHNSLLRLIERARSGLSADLMGLEEPAPADGESADSVIAPPTDPPQPPALLRLVSGYAIQQTDLPPLPIVAVQAPRPAADPIDSREEVVRGILVHGALETLGQTPLPEDIGRWLADRKPLFERQARAHDLSAGEASRVADQVCRHLQKVLKDADGRWLLSQSEQARSEFPITALVDGQITAMVVDRTFVAEGQRWVVDFKTAEPGDDEDPDGFIAAEVGRYRAQLERYGQALAALHGDQPRLALYLTALPRLVVL